MTRKEYKAHLLASVARDKARLNLKCEVAKRWRAQGIGGYPPAKTPVPTNPSAMRALAEAVQAELDLRKAIEEKQP